VVSFEVPTAAAQTPTIALQQDGTLVLLGAGATSCGKGASAGAGPYPAEWFSPSSPSAHLLGCFFDGSLRPVDGQWVALGPGPGTQASLELLTLATGASRTLAVFPSPGVFEPRVTSLIAAADFDGHELAWAQATCAGSIVQFAPDVAAMSPGAPLAARCPVTLHAPGTQRVAHGGFVRVGVTCPLGCQLVELGIARPRAFVHEGRELRLPPSGTPTIESFHLTRRQLTYLRSHRRVSLTITALSTGLGGPRSKVALHVILAR
jgi:hypothetical protein